jgi:hypothetical protein
MKPPFHEGRYTTIVIAAKSRPKSQARLHDDNRRSAIFCTIDFTQTISNPNEQTEARSEFIKFRNAVPSRAGILTSVSFDENAAQCKSLTCDRSFCVDSAFK